MEGVRGTWWFTVPCLSSCVPISHLRLRIHPPLEASPSPKRLIFLQLRNLHRQTLGVALVCICAGSQEKRCPLELLSWLLKVFHSYLEFGWEAFALVFLLGCSLAPSEAASLWRRGRNLSDFPSRGLAPILKPCSMWPCT